MLNSRSLASRATTEEKIAPRAERREVGPDMVSNESDVDLMDVAEIARVLHVPVSWVYQHTRESGKERIPHIKLGKYLRFEVAAVREWLNGLRNS